MASIKFEYEIPDGLTAITERLQQDADAKDLVVATFYMRGLLTLSEAGQILNKTKREFIQLLQKHELPVSGFFAPEEAMLERKLLGI